MKCFAARATSRTVPITALTPKQVGPWLRKQNKRVKNWLKSSGFDGKAGSSVPVPGADGSYERIVSVSAAQPTLWSFARLAETLPSGKYALEKPAKKIADAAAIGWGLASYRFDRYKKSAAPMPQLVWPAGVDKKRVLATVGAAYLGRTLINTPAEDMGPRELCAAIRAVAKRHGARTRVIRGDKLLEANYPAIHAVGRAHGKNREPHLVDVTWGEAKAPKLTLVGKGVVFDSGGLDIKPADFMRLMKKDMGGAAAVLALASMIMETELPVRLRVLVPTVENAISGDAYRPGDIVSTRKGLTVEIGNTDAEGRVILCDALAAADEEKPDLLIDVATLTGAARVALGTEVPVLFCNENPVASAALAASNSSVEPDPMWRLPLYAPYRRFLDSPVADLCNIGRTRYGGAITAALYLREFVEHSRWLHIDTMGYNDNPQPGRPLGGEVLGVRALYRMLSERYS